MALRYSFDMGKEADMVEGAIAKVLEKGFRTGDIMQEGMRKISTREMGEAVIGEMEHLAT
jgi:3-isopropylmalate dehydrogenase